MQDLKNKNVLVMIDGIGKLRCRVLGFANDEYTVVSKGNTFFIPSDKFGIYTIVEDKPLEPKIYMCKNSVSGCKGKKVLSCSEDPGIFLVECELASEHKCEFGTIGSIYTVPKEIVAALLEGAKTNGMKCPQSKSFAEKIKECREADPNKKEQLGFQND